MLKFMVEVYKIGQKCHQLSCTYVYYLYLYIYIYMHTHTHTHHSLWADGRKESEVGRCFLSLSIYMTYHISKATDQELVATVFTIRLRRVCVCRGGLCVGVCVCVCIYIYIYIYTVNLQEQNHIVLGLNLSLSSRQRI